MGQVTVQQCIVLFGQTTGGLVIPTIQDDMILVQVYIDDTVFSYTNDSFYKRFAKLVHSIYEMGMMGD